MPTDSARFQFIADALNGAGGFAPNVTADADGLVPRLTGASYLVRYPRESTEKFARRNQVAWYRNFLRSACLGFAGYLARKPPARTLTHPLSIAMAEDCDWRSNSLDVFWSSFILDAKARGSMLLLVDMPRRMPDNRWDQLETRSFPYLVPIPPERVVAYQLDPHGRLELAAIHDVDEQGKPVYRVWTATEWWVQRPGSLDDPSLRIDGDPHPVGETPVLAFTESGDYPHVGEFAQVADLSRRYFNAASERDEILRSQTFSLLTYHVPPDQPTFNAGEVAEAIGTHNMLTHRGDAPAFIAPPEGPATIYGEVLTQIEAAVRRIALTIEQPSQAESGIALTLRFQELNSALTHFSRRMEDLERRMWDIACRWLGVPDTTEVAWAKSYELADLATEMQILQNLQASGFPPEVIQAAMKQIVSAQFATLDPDALDALQASIDAMAQERNPDAGAEPTNLPVSPRPTET